MMEQSMKSKTKTMMMTYAFLILLFGALVEIVIGQPYIGGAYDIGEGRHGERRGDLGPAGIAGVTIGAVAVCVALVVTVYFCYYARNNSGNPNQNYPDTKYRGMGGSP
ncbi:hypothetical protein BLOT_010488 [Blomia tropicalis]|nr:hypothetical protein BLOT_010488 [Blomia tropicalis]